MDTLYSWTAYRAGAGITVQHSTGRIVGVREIRTDRWGQVRAERGGGHDDVVLSTAPHRDAETDSVNAGISDLFFNHEQACEAYRGDDPQAAADAVEGFRAMLRAAGLVPPTADALWSDFAARV